MSFSIEVKFAQVVLAVLLVPLTLPGAPIRMSFLDEGHVRRKTIELLLSRGSDKAAVRAFEQSVKEYNRAWPRFDLSKFPKRRNGFYSFESVSKLVHAIPGKLCEADHSFGINCFDVVILLLNGMLKVKLQPDELAGPFLVQQFTPEKETIISADRPLTAFQANHPSWYEQALQRAIPERLMAHQICSNAVLFQAHNFASTVDEKNISKVVRGELQTEWRRNGVKFPERIQLVLCHAVALPWRFFVTDHAGVLIPVQSGFVYLEKAGGKGPFVRLDIEDKADLRKWLATPYSEMRRQGYTDHFVTFNKDEIEELNVLALQTERHP